MSPLQASGFRYHARRIRQLGRRRPYILVQWATLRGICAEFGITEGTYDQRVHRFKAKWVPRCRQYRKERRWAIVVLLTVGGAALVVAALWWLLHGPEKTDR